MPTSRVRLMVRVIGAYHAAHYAVGVRVRARARARARVRVRAQLKARLNVAPRIRSTSTIRFWLKGRFSSWACVTGPCYCGLRLLLAL